jgi:FKBP-type peptidyl-prolyl cis-trans isomerase
LSSFPAFGIIRRIIRQKITIYMNKKTAIAVVIAVILVLLLLGRGEIAKLFTNNVESNTMQTATQVETQDSTVGTGNTATVGKEVTVHYTGIFTDGTKFDSSLDRGVPFTFKLGVGQVIKGWDIGVEGMKVGGKRIIVIPAEFGYGAQDIKDGSGNVVIPANSTLIFEVELLGVK